MKLVSELERQGHNVVILSGTPTELKSDLQPFSKTVTFNYFNIRSFFSGNYKSSSVLKKSKKYSKVRNVIKMRISNLINAFSFPDLEFFWCIEGKRKTSKVSEIINSFDGFEPDIIYASCLPISSGSLGATFSDYYKVPLVLEFRDKWLDSPYRDVNFLRRIFEEKYEKNLLKKANAIVGVSEYLASLGLKYSIQSEVIYTGIDDIDNSKLLSNNVTFDFIDETKKIILYTGMVYPGKRDPLKLVEIFNENSHSIADDYQLIFAGKNFDFIKSQSSSESIVFLGQIDRTLALELQQRADILLLLTWDNIHEEGVISGKVFEYLAAKKPILHIGYTKGEVAKLVRSSGVNFSQNTEQEDLIKGIKSLDGVYICNQDLDKLKITNQVAKLTGFLKCIVDD
ncbi:glycosyltransferase [Vibrio cyclitrophicus]